MSRLLFLFALVLVTLGMAGSATADRDLCDSSDCYGNPLCSDGIDNDGDWKIDYPADPGCSGTADNDEVDAPPPPLPPPPPPPPPPDPGQEDWDFNVGGLWHPMEFTTNDPKASGCKHPTVRYEYKGRSGWHHWTIFQRVNFCWLNGEITSFNRERWTWKTDHPLSGWHWQDWINSNCSSPTCSGRGVGTGATTAWTQGNWKFCSLFWVICHEVHPLIGTRVTGWGGVRNFWDVPQ